jgi:hypothetical protein
MDAGSPVTLASNQAVGDPCTFRVKVPSAISVTSTNIMVAALSGSSKIYICSYALISDTAAKISFIEGTGSGCTSATAAVVGSTTAASGMSVAANGGLTNGSGIGTVAATKTGGNALCILQSAAQLVSGVVSLVYAP